MKALRIGIIGGGPGGLMAAHLLEKRVTVPFSITLFEASDRLGGKIITRQFKKAPVNYEAGAAELYDYSQLGPDPLREMVAEFGLATSPMAGGTVVMDDRILRDQHDIRREYGARTTRVLKHFNKFARAQISPMQYYESDWKQDNEDPMMNRSFHALLARVPDDAARRYIQVAVHSDLATEPHQTSAAYGLANYLMDETDYMQLYTINGGIERLPQEIAKRLKAQVHLNQPVVRVERTSQGTYRVFSRPQGQAETLSNEFDFVIVALPNNWIPAVEWAGPALAQAMHKHHAYYDYPAHYLRVSILFEKAFWRGKIDGSFFMLDAFEGCCVYDESSRDGAAADAGQYGVLGWLLGGEAAVTMSNFADDVLIGKMLDALPSSLRHGRELFLEGYVHRWAGAVNGLPGGRPLKETESRHFPEGTNDARLFVVGDYLFDSTINGLLDSADYAVELVLEEIEKARLLNINGSPILSHVNGTAAGKGTAPFAAAEKAIIPLPVASQPENGKPRVTVETSAVDGSGNGQYTDTAVCPGHKVAEKALTPA